MEFKKHFSTNLQNLSVKKTLILNPPPNNADPALRPSPSRCHNKQNIKDNQPWQSRKQDIGNTSPMLSFNKIKRNAIQNIHREQQQHNRQLQTTHILSQTSRTNLVNNACCDSSRNFNSNQQSKTVRMGSMLFGSLRKDQPFDSKCIRESRSIDRMAPFKTQRDEAVTLECSNGDGQQAKYKVSQGQDELISYCFNCAISLVKHGFSIEQLTADDRRRLSQRHSNAMSRSDFQQRHKEISGSRFSCQRGPGQRVKVGEQAKCRIIMRLNKLKVGREEFNKSIETHLDNINYFYNALAALIEQQRVADTQQLLRMKAIRKTEPQNYESQLSSALGTIEYMMKNLQGVNYQFLSEVDSLLQHEVTYPKMRISVEPIEGFQHKIEQFSNYFEKNLKISMQEDEQYTGRSRSRQSSQADQYAMPRNHPLRFSFEEALQQVPKRGNYYQGEASMNPLLEESESELEQSLPIVERRQNAFRNLFPEDQFSDSDMDRPKQSPVFKQF